MRPFRFFFGISLAVIAFFFVARFLIFAFIVAAILSTVFFIARRIMNFFHMQRLQYEEQSFLRIEDDLDSISFRQQREFFDFPDFKREYASSFRTIEIQ